MKLGLIGLPNSGKTTVFNALTKSEASITAYSDAKAEPNLAVVEVRDERITHLSEIYKPKKTTYATIEIVDFVGLSQGSAKEGTFSNSQMALVKIMDSLTLVVRNFHDDLLGEPVPLKDVEDMEVELLISDLIIAEKRLENIEWSYKRGKKTSDLQTEEITIKRIHDQLSDNRPIRDMELTAEEKKLVRGFQFLTQKPMLVILNSDESNFGSNQDILVSIEKQYNVLEFAGKFEMELSRLTDPEEISLFMEDMGITGSARDRLTQTAYQTLGYISFLTVGNDEVRAWNIVKGQTAVEAAGSIHSDLARGFIRAECFSYTDLIECGSEKAVRDQGRFRLEGKDYVVKDGDILNIRFSV